MVACLCDNFYRETDFLRRSRPVYNKMPYFTSVFKVKNGCTMMKAMKQASLLQFEGCKTRNTLLS